MSTDVFISYATQDQKLADSVCKALEKAGISCWIAPRNILPGVEYADGIIDGLNNSRIFLVILSQASNSSPQVAREVERAVSKNLHILTFRTDNTVLSRAMEYYLSNHHWIDASDKILSKQLVDLTSTVKQLLQRYPQKEEKNLTKEVEKVVEKVQKVDLQAEINPATRPVIPKEASKGKTVSRKQNWKWIGICGGLSIVLIFAGYMILSGKIPLGQLPAEDKTQSTQASFNNSGKPVKTATLIAEQAWVQGFATPILIEIGNRSPDFYEYFTDLPTDRWDGLDPKMFSVENGQLRARITNLACYGISPHVNARDMVIKYEFTPISLKANEGGIVVQAHGFTFNIGFANVPQPWWGITYPDPSGDWPSYDGGYAALSRVNATTYITFIARGTKFAVYVNNRPFVYYPDMPFTGNSIGFAFCADKGTAVIDLDNIEIWDLNK